MRDNAWSRRSTHRIGIASYCIRLEGSRLRGYRAFELLLVDSQHGLSCIEDSELTVLQSWYNASQLEAQSRFSIVSTALSTLRFEPTVTG